MHFVKWLANYKLTYVSTMIHICPNILSNKLVNELKCENESLKMHAKYLIAEPISKNDENICCNHAKCFVAWYSDKIILI